MRPRTTSFLFAFGTASIVFAQFAPPAGQPGTTAIHADSSAFTAWATGCTVVRGPMDISNVGLGPASTGDESMALGAAGSNGVISLGDGGTATLTFAEPISNGPGWDFAVFENGFSDTFLELAFVEVSSNGEDFFRFPATSNAPTDTQVGGFGATDATLIDNLAGKYRAMYGTPFDLDQLVDQAGLDVNAITHVRIVDVVGCIQEAYASHDHLGHVVNDPWNTPFASSGFDLDAVGVIHALSTGIERADAAMIGVELFPNPAAGQVRLRYTLQRAGPVDVQLTNAFGQQVRAMPRVASTAGTQDRTIELDGLAAGTYFVNIRTGTGRMTRQLFVQ